MRLSKIDRDGFGSSQFWPTFNFSFGEFVISPSLLEKLSHRGIQVDTSCLCCRNEDESIVHCLVFRPHAPSLCCGRGFPYVFTLFMNIVLDNLPKVMHILVKVLVTISPLIMWNIWCSRNKLILEDQKFVASSIIATSFVQQQQVA